MKRKFIGLLAAAAIVAASFLLLPEAEAAQPADWPAVEGNSFVLRGARVFDGEVLHEKADVLVRDGIVVAASGKVASPDGTPELPADGYTLLPALIDAHTHNFGTARRDALRFGVGTQIDMFSDVSALASAKRARESLEPADQADMWSAGTLVTASGGHGTQFGVSIPTLDDAADAKAFVAARIGEGSDFIKLILESGSAFGRDLPTLDAATLSAAIEGARTGGKLAVVHVSTRADAETAVAAGADAFVHLFGDAEIDDALIARIRERGMSVIPTLSVLESISGRTSGLDDDPRVAPYLAPDQRDSLARSMSGEDGPAAVIARAQRSTRALFDAGVPILAGSDAPNPGTAHGASLHRELELLVAAGLAPIEALAAATSVPARHFTLTDRGRIAPGLRADLMLVAGDPLADITATREIVAIWKNGFRIERSRFDGEAPAAATLDEPVLGTFDHGEDGWMPTADRIQGGRSDASQGAADGVLAVSGEIRSGSVWPWGGTIRTFGAQPFEPVDASAYSVLSLRVRGDGGVLSVLFFAGEGGQAPPLTRPLERSTGWQELEIPLDEVAGLDPAHLRAIAIVAGPDERTFRFEIDSVVLR